MEPPRFKALTQELESNKALYQKLEIILNSSHDGIYITDGTGRAKVVNDAYFRITGLKREDVFEKTLDQLIEDGYIKESVAKKVIESKKVTTILQEIREKQVMITGTPLLDEKGDVKLIVINIRDITELNSLRDQLESTRRLSDRYYSELSELRLQQLKMEDLVVKSRGMEEILQMALRVARVDSTVLLEGESGVGKGIFAKLIHKASRRAEKPFIKVNCAAIPETLMESELFGYEKGAFTGASREGKIGLFELANEGTIFLDEIGELPLALQVKLLQVLENGELRRVGGVKDVRVDVRMIAATNRDLEQMLRGKLFREDLYFRLKVVPIRIPPLRERKIEIPAFVSNFVNKFNKRYDLEKRISIEAVHLLQQYPWLGNIRELENLVESLIVMTERSTIDLKDLPAYITDSLFHSSPERKGGKSMELKTSISLVEQRMLEEAMRKFRTTREAARALGISQASIVRKMKRYGIKQVIHE